MNDAEIIRAAYAGAVQGLFSKVFDSLTMAGGDEADASSSLCFNDWGRLAGSLRI